MTELEQALRQVEADHPPWHTWIGVSGIVYARRPLSSPPAVMRAETVEQLVSKIEEWEWAHARC